MLYAYLLLNSLEVGLVESWDECQKIVHKKPARFKKFSSIKDANVWLSSELDNLSLTSIDDKVDSIFFDSGVGRGIGVESRVTDFYKNSLLHHSSYAINDFGNYLCPEGSTNNYGELMGLNIALDLAVILDKKTIIGDSELVIRYWSKGVYKEVLPETTVSLIGEVVKKRLDFESLGGRIYHVSGDLNPADLGYHKKK